MLKRLTILIILGLAVMPMLVAAATVDPAQVVDGNFFASDRSVEIRGAVKHDAMIAATHVQVSGNVAGDALIIAHDVEITGSVEGNARILARYVTINGSVGKNVTILAHSLVLGKNARVGWDFLARTATTTMDGTIDGEFRDHSRWITLNGTVRKNVFLQVPRFGQVVIGSSAVVSGDLLFFSPAENLLVDAKAQIQGRVSHDPSASGVSARVIAALVMLLGSIVTGAALLFMAPGFFSTSTALLQREPARAVKTTLLTVVASVVIIPLAMLTGVGLPLAFLLMGALLAAVYLSHLVIAYAVGFVLLQKVDRPLPPFPTLVSGLVLFTVIASLPGLGALVWIATALFGVGAIVLVVKRVTVIGN